MRSASCRDWEGESPCPANSADQREMEAEAAEEPCVTCAAMRAKYHLLRSTLRVVIDPMHRHMLKKRTLLMAGSVCGCFSGGTLRNRKGVAEALPIA